MSSAACEDVPGVALRASFLLLAAFAVGCPNAADLENPSRFDRLTDAPPPKNTSCNQELPAALPSGCDYQLALRTYCATSGCHGAVSSGGLDLRPDSLLIARILEVPAKHRLSCSAGVPCVASEATCDECTMCPEGALLVNRRSPVESWMLQKLAPFSPGTTTSNEPMSCGDAMPSFLTNAPIRSYSDQDKACLVEFFTTVATSTPEPERFPCTPDVDGGVDGGT